MGTAERKERERMRRHNDILDAAEEVFFQKGLDEATMSDVAEKAELSKGTIYLYFTNKEALYMGISHRAIETLRRKFEESLNRHETAEDKIMSLGQTYIEFASEYPFYFSTMSFVETIQLKSIEKLNDDPLTRQCFEAGKGVLELIADTIKMGQEQGIIRPELHPMKMAILLWASGNGAIQMSQNKGSQFNELHGFKEGFLLDEYLRMCALSMFINPPERFTN